MPPEPHSPRPLAERIVASLPGLASYVRERMGPDLAAKESVSDIVQSTCRELLRGAGGFEDRGEGAFQRWLRQAAEHKIRNRVRHWRAARRDHATEPLDGTASRPGAVEDCADPTAHPAGDQAELADEAARLERAVRALPPDYREIVRRSQVEGQRYAEIAAAMGRTPEAVRKLLARALARLSADLDPSA